MLQSLKAYLFCFRIIIKNQIKSCLNNDPFCNNKWYIN